MLSLPFVAGAQTVINIYARVTAISGTTLTISNATGTMPVGNAIIMQMKDSVVQTSTGNNSNFGNVDNIQSAGLSEIVSISSVSGSSVVIAAATKNSYHFSSNSRVQLISYPTLGSPNYTVSSSLTAYAWDGNVGGVLAFNVAGTLTLNSNLIVDGTGYRGGSVGTNAPSDYSCDGNTYYDNAGGATTTYYGFKGEGVYNNTASYTVAKGKMANGAGGGNVDNAGGGGGGNFTAGGQGGFGWGCSATSNGGGVGGADMSNYITTTRFFMGGGGGGGQQNNAVGTPGGNGGGIVMVKANSIQTIGGCTGGSLKISAQGATAANPGNDGSGGGGAGGTVLLAANNYAINNACPLTIMANGGTGGTVQNTGSHGGGGGGGKGTIIFSPQSAVPSNVTIANSVGTGGGNSTSTGTTTASNGTTVANSGGTGVLYGSSSTLPVTILDFSASYSNNTAELSWNTTMEMNFSHFEIERSINSTDAFTTVGTMAPKGSNSSYSFSNDLGFITGPAIVYYRLKLVDLDGTVRYSDIVNVKIGTYTLSAKAYPVPTLSTVNVSVNVPASVNSLQVFISDMQGRVVKRYGSVAVTNGSPVSLSLEGLSAGQYIIEMGNGVYKDHAVVIKL